MNIAEIAICDETLQQTKFVNSGRSEFLCAPPAESTACLRKTRIDLNACSKNRWLHSKLLSASKFSVYGEAGCRYEKALTQPTWQLSTLFCAISGLVATPKGGRPLRAFVNRDSLEKRPPVDQASTDANLVGIITISEYLNLDLLLAIFQVFNTAELLKGTLLCVPMEDAICVARSYKGFEYAITALHRLQCHVQRRPDRNAQIRLNTFTIARHIQNVWSPNCQGTTSTLGASAYTSITLVRTPTLYGWRLRHMLISQSP